MLSTRPMISLAFIASAASPALAEEACVVCNDPPATYRCNAGSAGASGPGLQLLCVKQIATRGGHLSCTIDRTRTGAPCNGVLVTLDEPPQGTAPTTITAPPLSSPIEATLPPPVQPKDAPPATMEALAKETAGQSKKEWDATSEKIKETTQAAGQNLKKAGGSVGDAVKKSWNCVVSLFSSC